MIVKTKRHSWMKVPFQILGNEEYYKCRNCGLVKIHINKPAWRWKYDLEYLLAGDRYKNVPVRCGIIDLIYESKNYISNFIPDSLFEV